MRSTNLASAKNQYEANSFASAASTLASSTRTPWAAYDAGFYAAQAADVTAVSNAAKTNAIAQATAQKTAEVTQIDAETAWRNAYATASSVLSTGIASANLGFATAQSLIYSSMGGSNLQLPTVSRPTDLAGKYKVPGPGNTYRASISSVSSTNYYYGWWGGYWWGAWGYFGSGYWYSGYGGYGGYLYGSQVSSAAGVSLAEPQMQFPDSFWQIDSDQIADQMQDGTIEVRYGDAKVTELVIPQQAIFAGVGGVAEDDGDGDAGGVGSRAGDSGFGGADGGSISANVAVSDGMGSSNAELMAILQGLSDTAGELWTLVGSVTQTVLSSRPAMLLADYASELVYAQLQNSASSSSKSSLTSDKGTASSSTSVTVALSEGSLDAAVSALEKTALFTKPADLTAMQKLNAYLQGVSNQKGPSIFDQASQISVNLVMGYINGQNGSITEYGTGFAKGFFVDGAWGNVEGIGTIFKFGWGAVKQSWYNQARAITFGNEWIFENQYFNFSDQRTVEENVVKAGQMIFKVLNAVGTELGEEAFAHYHALANGSAADLQELGGKHQQVAAAVMSIGVLLSEKLRDMTPETRGRISGAITWEIAQTAAEIIFTAGAATVATKGAKFARIADKLADFAKTYDKLGDIAQPVLNRLRQISEPGGELRKLLEKFDEKAVVVERAVKIVNETLDRFCFHPDTVVSTPKGQFRICDLQPNTTVCSLDDVGGSWVPNLILDVHHNVYSGKWVTIKTPSGTIECTANHPFWVVDGDDLSHRPKVSHLSGEDFSNGLVGRWVNSDQLQVGDRLASHNRSKATVLSVTISDVENAKVCNLTIQGSHNFAVGADAVLVHNIGWCDILTKHTNDATKKAEFLAARERLAKQFDVPIERIHGHHIVQNRIPTQFDEVENGKKIRDYDAVDPSWTTQQQQAWYVGKSHEILEEVKVKRYSVSEFGSDELAHEAAEAAAKRGETIHNLTLAPNGHGTHTLATQKEVWERLARAKGNKANVENALGEISKDFMAGRMPR